MSIHETTYIDSLQEWSRLKAEAARLASRIEAAYRKYVAAGDTMRRVTHLETGLCAATVDSDYLSSSWCRKKSKSEGLCGVHFKRNQNRINAKNERMLLGIEEPTK